MAEYVEREKVLSKAAPVEGCFSDMISAYDVVMLPAADVAPVRHGRWEIVVGSNEKEYMVCTCCRVSQDLTGVFTYCPNCGCRMDEGADNEM